MLILFEIEGSNLHSPLLFHPQVPTQGTELNERKRSEHGVSTRAQRTMLDSLFTEELALCRKIQRVTVGRLASAQYLLFRGER